MNNWRSSYFSSLLSLAKKAYRRLGRRKLNDGKLVSSTKLKKGGPLPYDIIVEVWNIDGCRETTTAAINDSSRHKILLADFLYRDMEDCICALVHEMVHARVGGHGLAPYWETAKRKNPFHPLHNFFYLLFEDEVVASIFEFLARYRESSLSPTGVLASLVRTYAPAEAPAPVWFLYIYAIVCIIPRHPELERIFSRDEAYKELLKEHGDKGEGYARVRRAILKLYHAFKDADPRDIDVSPERLSALSVPLDAYHDPRVFLSLVRSEFCRDNPWEKYEGFRFDD